MKTLCAWCRAIISDGEGPISHGICSSCKGSFAFQSGVDLRTFIDSLPFPILVLDNRLNPVCINNSGVAQLGKSAAELEQCSIGEIFECEYSRLPEGCGRTVHCSGCVIRKSITLTNETGQPQNMVPAILTTNDSVVAYYVSTTMADDCVVLKLEKALVPTTVAKTTVLLVEDDESILRMVSEALTAAGYSVMAAMDAQQALKMVSEFPGKLAAVITDFSMPGMSGIDLIRTLRQSHPTIKPVVFSGHWLYPLPEELDIEFVSKPCSPANLIAAINRPGKDKTRIEP